MKLRSCMALPVFCSGNSSATCEKVLSGAKRCARNAFALLIVFSFILSFPVSAGKLFEFNALIQLEPQTFGYRNNSLTENTDWGFGSVPTTIEINESGNTAVYNFQNTAITHLYSAVTAGGKKLEYTLNFGDGSEPYVDVQFSLFRPLVGFYLSGTYPFKFTGYYEVYVDGQLYSTSGDYTDTVPWFGFNDSVKQYINIVYYMTADCVTVYDVEVPSTHVMSTYCGLEIWNLLVNNQPTQLDRIEIDISNIESDVDDIRISVENLQDGVAKIEGSVTDMKEQLENSSSPIWSAAGEKIADTLTGLFVPPQEELEAKKQELEQKLDDKLGSAGDLVDVGEEFVSGVMGGFGRDDIANNYRLQFPGITFPMNGEEFVIVPAQEVKLNNRAFVIFQDALGFAVTAICFFSIIHICEDAIYCLISGVSYWGFIRSRHDK